MKRFTETQKWGKPWFRRLPPRHKLLWQWLCDNCDAAGVVDPDWDVCSLQIGEQITDADLAAFEDRVKTIRGGKLWISSFIEFQYGHLSRTCKPHAPVYTSLEKHGISLDGDPENERVSKGYPKGVDTLQEKEKEKDKEKDKEFPLPEKVQDSLRQLFRRKPSTPWSPKECAAAKVLRQIPESDLLEDITLFAEARGKGWAYHRQEPLTLLNNWAGDVDKAGNFLRTLPEAQHSPDANTEFGW